MTLPMPDRSIQDCWTCGVIFAQTAATWFYQCPVCRVPGAVPSNPPRSLIRPPAPPLPVHPEEFATCSSCGTDIATEAETFEGDAGEDMCADCFDASHGADL